MQLYIKDSIDVELPRSVTVSDKDNKKTNYEITDSAFTMDTSGKFLEITVDATHCGYFNRNGYFYRMEGMAESAGSFISPYQKPVLIEHEDSSKPVGRATSAAFIPIPKGTYSLDSDKARIKGMPTGKIRVKALISDRTTIQDVLESRYITVSIGGRPIGAPECSVCGDEVVMGMFGPMLTCDHELGEVDDKKGYVGIMVDGMDYSEFSFVNQPADYTSEHAASVVSMALVDETNIDSANQFDSVEFGEEFIYDGVIMKKEAEMKKSEEEKNETLASKEEQQVADSQLIVEPEADEAKASEADSSEEPESKDAEEADEKPAEEPAKEEADEEPVVEESKEDAPTEEPEAEKSEDEKPEAEEAAEEVSDAVSDEEVKDADLEEENKKLKEEISNLEAIVADKEDLLRVSEKRIVDLSESLKDSLAEKVIDLSILVDTEEVKEIKETQTADERQKAYKELKDELVKKATKTLNDDISDLNKKLIDSNVSEKVDNPTLNSPEKIEDARDPFKSIIESKKNKNSKDDNGLVSRLLNKGYTEIKEEN